VKTLREGLAGNSIDRIYGILNGTCNYILTGWSRQAAVRRVSKGSAAARYAESRSTFDIEGHDTGAEARDSFQPCLRHQGRSEPIYVEGISSIAPAVSPPPTSLLSRQTVGRGGEDAAGHRAARASDMVRKDSAIAQVMGVTNAVTIDARHQPADAGRPAPAEPRPLRRLLSDIGDIARAL